MREPICVTSNRSLSCALALFVLTASSVAGAEPHPPELLRARVGEELVREGVSLAGLGRALAIQARGEGVVVILTDGQSGRIVAQRDVPRLPGDREAAIAHLTLLVASMVQAEQLGTSTAPEVLLAGWRAAFVAERVVAHHRPRSIAIFAGGDRRGDSGAAVLSAAVALGEAYRGAGVEPVPEPEGLGDLDGLDDPAIVARAASTQAESIAVVRVLSGGPRLRALVSIYDRRAALVTAYTTTAGEPVRPPGPESGGPPGAATATAKPPLAQDGEPGRAQQEYARRSISMKWDPDDVEPDYYVWTSLGERAVDGAEFYDAVGRADLAASVRRRRSGGVTALVVGGILVNAAFLYPLLNSCDGSFDEVDSCFESRWLTALGVAAAGFAVGGVGLYHVIRRDPLDPPERVGLAREYNGRLRRELGLPQEVGQIDRADRAFVSLGLAPFVGENGGGMSLVGRF